MKTSIKIALWCLGVGLVLAIIALDPLELWIGLGEFGQSVFDWFVELGRWMGPSFWPARSSCCLSPALAG